MPDLVSENASSQEREETLVEQATHSKDKVVVDLAHGFLSSVDREGSNTKYPTKQAEIERKIREQNPRCDATVLYLQHKYGHSYGD